MSPGAEESDLPDAEDGDRWPGELESSLRWEPQVAVASVAAVVLSLLLARQRPPGWVGVVLVVLGLLAGYLAVVWLRTRARVAVQGTRLRVRRVHRVVEVEAGAVTAVRQRLGAQGPDFVVVADGRRVLVPVSRLRRGHSAFFGWLLGGGGQPELDRGTRHTLEVVRSRGLIEP